MPCGQEKSIDSGGRPVTTASQHGAAVRRSAVNAGSAMSTATLTRLSTDLFILGETKGASSNNQTGIEAFSAGDEKCLHMLKTSVQFSSVFSAVNKPLAYRLCDKFYDYITVMNCYCQTAKGCFYLFRFTAIRRLCSCSDGKLLTYTGNKA